MVQKPLWSGGGIFRGWLLEPGRVRAEWMEGVMGVMGVISGRQGMRVAALA
jgi:hypothetical protein